MKEPVLRRHGISFKKGMPMFLPSRAVGMHGKRRGIRWKKRSFILEKRAGCLYGYFIDSKIPPPFFINNLEKSGFF
jgi:hypothetical protein